MKVNINLAATKIVAEINPSSGSANVAKLLFTDGTEAVVSLRAEKGYFNYVGNEVKPTFCQPNGMLNADVTIGTPDEAGNCWLQRGTSAKKKY
jgi:hypothetical protein